MQFRAPFWGGEPNRVLGSCHQNVSSECCCCCCCPAEAGEGEDGRMKSAIGIGALLMDGLGDTIRVSLTGVWLCWWGGSE
jgi:hypothetical protein